MVDPKNPNPHSKPCIHNCGRLCEFQHRHSRSGAGREHLADMGLLRLLPEHQWDNFTMFWTSILLSSMDGCVTCWVFWRITGLGCRVHVRAFLLVACSKVRVWDPLVLAGFRVSAFRIRASGVIVTKHICRSLGLSSKLAFIVITTPGPETGNPEPQTVSPIPK